MGAMVSRFLGPNEIAVNYSSWALIKDVYDFIKPYKWRFWVATALKLSAELAVLYPIFAFASIVNILTKNPSNALNQSLVLVFFWMIAVLWRMIGRYFGKVMCFQISEKVSLDAQFKTIQHLFLLDMIWQEKESAGSKLKKIQNAGIAFDRIIRMWINNTIEISVSFVGIILIIARFDVVISLIMIVFLAIYFIISRFLTPKAASAAYLVNVQEENVHGLIFELISNIRSVKIMSIMGSLLGVLEKEIQKLYRKIKNRIVAFQSRGSILDILVNIFKFLIVIMVVYGIVKGRYEIGFLIMVNFYFNTLAKSIEDLSEVSQDFAVSRYSISRMKALLNEPIKIDSEEGKVSFPANWRTIKVKNVSFSYGEHNQVLNNLSFEIKRGEKIGIMGLSGSGKSTLFKLLLKEHENFEGEILFDGEPIQKISKRDYFNHAAVVMQETEVFNFSLKDNITIANPELANDDKHLKESLDIAHVSEFINKLPEGLETYIGEKGVKLSGGEKQRVGLARAIFKKPQILFLDEATSHLDLESEEKIQDSLQHFFKNVTALVIAHRLTTIRQMDKILVIEEGRLVEAGNFDELYKKRGRFYDLWEKQKL